MCWTGKEKKFTLNIIVYCISDSYYTISYWRWWETDSTFYDIFFLFLLRDIYEFIWIVSFFSFFFSLFRCYCLVGQSQNHSILEFDNVCKFFQIASHLLNVNNDIWPMDSYTSFNVLLFFRDTDSESDLQANFLFSFWKKKRIGRMWSLIKNLI